MILACLHSGETLVVAVGVSQAVKKNVAIIAI
jgi:hypothetical protein